MTETVSATQAQREERSAYRTKLIEVALPLEAINVASAREKSIRHGHPSTLHLWWARRPLAACRAVLFAQLVDDPSACPEEFPTEEAQEAERQRLFRIIERLVLWENSNNPAVIEVAQREIARSVARTAGVPAPETPEDVRRVLEEHAPPVYDPFCGGGSIPLEAQRLGLEAHASDLNPVAVLITKAMIEIPPKFAGQPPVNPEARCSLIDGQWTGAQGLAEDVRYYGKWMRDEAWKRIGHLYPKVKLPPGQGGGEATVIAWLWARTVTCPNPACGARMPLVRSFALSTKKGRDAWVEPIVDHATKTVRFEVRSGKGTPPGGTVSRSGARCIVCGSSVPLDHVRVEGKAGRMSQNLMAVVAEGRGGRTYVSPSDEQVSVSLAAHPEWAPETDLPEQALGFRVQLYGMTKHRDLFTPRQLVALTTFSDLVSEARERVRADAAVAGLPDDGAGLEAGGVGAVAYSDAVATYLAFALDKLTDTNTSLCTWQVDPPRLRATFGRPTLSMTWDVAEANVFGDAAGDYQRCVKSLCEVLEDLTCFVPAAAFQADAASTAIDRPHVISTDPPYYDNIGYADLSDFFYVWLRRPLRSSYPQLLASILVPKSDELVANPFRFGGDRETAERFFRSGLERAFDRARAAAGTFPLVIYYAFKQAEESRDSEGAVSTGWETMLSGLMHAGLAVCGTWPMRSELMTRNRNRDSNALASSIVLVCRSRSSDAGLATRREFVAALRQELPEALKKLQHGNVAPVDLAQASIGPGMAIFSRYAKVLEADGSPMSVRTALQIINQELDAYLTALEGEMDADTRFCVAWFEQYGMKTAKFGEADVLARAKNISVEGLVRAGVLLARSGEVRLLARQEMDPEWNPRLDRRPADWECAQHLILALEKGSEDDAGRLARLIGPDRAQVARDLAYRLYAICERKGWADEALAYNTLVVSWPGIQEKAASEGPEQGRLI